MVAEMERKPMRIEVEIQALLERHGAPSPRKARKAFRVIMKTVGSALEASAIIDHLSTPNADGWGRETGVWTESSV